ncbi:MAG: DUF433 domain-containing protein [Blastocatellia bacterium]
MNQHQLDTPINNPVVTGTIQWPTIKNTRLTLFDLMDQLKQGLPPHYVANWYHLSAAEMDEVMRFLAEHTAELEQSYAEANAYAEEQRQYWTERNQHLLERDISQSPPPPGSDPRIFAAWEKLVALKRANARNKNRANENPR